MFIYSREWRRTVQEICSGDGDNGPKKCHRHPQLAGNLPAKATHATIVADKWPTISALFADLRAQITCNLTTVSIPQPVTDLKSSTGPRMLQPQLTHKTIKVNACHPTLSSDFETPTDKKSLPGATAQWNTANGSSINTSVPIFTTSAQEPGMIP